ncbi:hypothetical protein, partial [Curtobacterium sp. VKM Ac-2922]|uniref:hypothetical protein n=1 Tax=Curtobacterium sp. VKM Ac-2922 TaxID=2929475 RepID=UPI001FB3943A
RKHQTELILTVDCLLTIFNPKGIVSDSTSKLTEHGVNKLALTMCTLLSSQGPDALTTRPHEEVPPERHSFLSPPERTLGLVA